MAGRNLVPVFTAFGALEAESIRAFLESEGYQAVVSQESAGITYGLTVGPLGQAQVLVPADQAEQALETLKAMEQGLFELPDEPGEDSQDDGEEDKEDPDQKS
ncbi:MAG: DUF2007 domain-containing protein [Chloroflexi bacterium]|nr:DUF2007 domain-containing protein [Anaerolineaceae bacterium]NMB87095.1 DUF2007 domain-containing protein [Chloroflexota bacterium]